MDVCLIGLLYVISCAQYVASGSVPFTMLLFVGKSVSQRQRFLQSSVCIRSHQHTLKLVPLYQTTGYEAIVLYVK